MSDIDQNATGTKTGESQNMPTAHDAPRRIKSYDFRRPDKFAAEQIRTLAIMHETFARLNTVSLSALLRSVVHIELASVDQLTYEEFITSVPNPSLLAIANMDPLKGASVTEIDPSIVFTMLDRLFGGQGDGVRVNREPTEIEMSVLEGVIIRILGNLREAWSMVINLRPRLGQIETNPQFAQLVPPNEMAALVTLETRIGDVTGMINLCLPYITIESIMNKLSAAYMYSTVRRRAGQRETPVGYGANIPVDVELCTEAPRLSLSELAHLKPGEMIPLEAWTSGVSYLRSGGVQTSCVLESTDRNTGMSFTLPDAPASEAERALIVGDSEENLGTLIEEREPSPTPAIREELQQGFSRIFKRIEELGNRQDELADHVLLTGKPEPAKSTESAKEEEPWKGGPFSFLRAIDGEALGVFVENEAPQLIAFILSSIEPPIASIVFQRLGRELQVEVAHRIYSIGPVSPEVIDAVRRVLEMKISRMAEEDDPVEGGASKLADILGLVSKSTEKHVVDSLAEQAPEIHEEMTAEKNGNK